MGLLCANAEPEPFWQLRQWQTTAPRSLPVTVRLTALQRQEMRLVTLGWGDLLEDMVVVVWG